MSKSSKILTATIGMLTMLTLLASFALIDPSGKEPLQDPSPKPKKTPVYFKKGSEYKAEWAVVDSLQQLGLSKSALDQVLLIEGMARKAENYEQIVKALIYRSKFESYLVENALVGTIVKFQREADTSDYPIKPVLHSLLGEMYWKYYTRNRWVINNRTPLPDVDQEDILVWDTKRIIDAAIKNYNASLIDEDQLQRTSLYVMEEVIRKNRNSEAYRPTLYDFLAHRALDFFMGEEPTIIAPAYKFTLDKPAYFHPYNNFSDLNTDSRDTLSTKLYAVKTLQRLIRFHMSDQDPVALIDLELKRLKFVKNNISVPGKDSLYFEALKALERKFPSSPGIAEVKYEIAQVYYNRGKNYDPLKSDENKWDIKTAYTICKQVQKDFPSTLGASQCGYLLSNIEKKSINVTTEKVNYPGVPWRALIQYQNLTKIYLKIVKADPDKLEKWNRDSNRDEFLTKVMKEGEVKRTWDLILKTEGDFQQHASEIKLESLEPGHYVLLSSTSSDFKTKNEAVTYTPFWMSKLGFLSRKESSDKMQFFLFDRNTGDPVTGASAQLFYKKYNYVTRNYEDKKMGSYTTDQNGSFEVGKTEEYRNFTVLYEYNGDRINTNDNFYQYRSYEENRNKTKSIFFTDRAIYRPGQTIYFKGIVLNTDGKTNEIKPNHVAKVQLYDVNSQLVGDLSLKTNEYGTYSGSFTAPSGGLNGQMRITDGYGTKYISVEEYKRPKFEVSFNPVKGSYKLNETVTVTGMAKTYSGAPLDDVDVKYRVVRNASFPYWCYWWFGFSPSSSQMEIKNGDLKTDDKGEYKIEFTAIPDQSVNRKYSPTYTYTVYADVTDINGETHSTNAYVSVGYKALNLSFNIPEDVNKSGKDKFDIYSNNLNGEYEASKGSIKIWSLKMPKQYYRSRILGKQDYYLISEQDYRKDFPSDLYKDEDNKYKWDKDIKVYDRPYDTEKDKKLTLLKLPEWQQGYYVMEATTTDKFGQEVKETKYFCVFGENEKYPATNKMLWVKRLGGDPEPGQQVEVVVSSACKGAKLMFEVESEGKIVERSWITLNGQQQKLSVPVLEQHRGGLDLHFTMVKEGRSFTRSEHVNVPYTNKMLDVEFETFRNKLMPGQKEEWKIRIKDKKGEKVAAEMVATLYDASLDVFRSNVWDFNVLNYAYSNYYWQSNSSFTTSGSRLYQENWNKYSGFSNRVYDQLNWFGFQPGYGRYGSYSYRGYDDEYSDFDDAGVMLDMVMYETEDESMEEEETIVTEKRMMLASTGASRRREVEGKESTKSKDSAGDIPPDEAGEPNGEGLDKKGGMENIQTRKNFNETAFFFPKLETNENGEVIIAFTIPEALTKWKFMGLAHTKDLKFGQITNETVTQKDLMVYPNAPRFFRENDKMVFSTKINNLADKEISGTAQVFFFDALSMKPIDSEIIKGKSTASFNIEALKSTEVSWQLEIPEGFSAITYRVVAKAGKFTDGEEMAIPTLTNRMLVTETMPLPVRSKQTKTFRFDKLVDNKSGTLRNHKLTLEFTSNPAWYAVQALPYLIEYPHECAEQTFSRYYANSIATNIANSSPKIKAVFDTWKNQSPESFLSNLEKNQELKSVVLEETPWVMNAQNESERKKRVGLLFDLNRMSNEMNRAMNKLQKMQVSNGGWPWFPGMPESRYITQHIVTGMGHLDHLGVEEIRKDYKTFNMVKRAIRYLDDEIREDYEDLIRYKVDMSEDHLSYDQIQYLYARSYFNDVVINNRNQEAIDYFKGQAKKYWTTKSRYMQGMIALALNREQVAKTGIHVEQQIMASLKENAINHEELGMYWKGAENGYYWYQAPIETQALLIEAFDEVSNDQESVESMKVWLLKQKQTQDWKTTKATTEACYALLLRGTDWLASDEMVEITVGSLKIDPGKDPDMKVEAGTGYFKTSWNKTEIKPEMGTVKLKKKDDGVSWGAMYWQYFEQLDKITPSKTPLHLEKKLFVVRNSDAGPVLTPITEKTPIKVGDKIKVRIELRVDRDMEYVHMKDMRASGLEPINVFSGYRWQDGLGYYESTKDASTNFFFDYLRKGTYVFEYPLRANISGDFSNGITSIQCMYAPEFTSHSEGIRVKVARK